ncbi:NAD-dependent epimerase [Singulisphaera sp. Ch08]|uniref:NAD-dependent epimerase n=1 Tax=Singulisphaera sp. Ch08 TaxID=3120278 RepID=A0AAU7CQE0_9BACT
MKANPGITLVTGAAGFIGYHVARRLLEDGEEVLALDNLNSYYDVRLKEARLSQLKSFPGFRFEEVDLADRSGIESLFDRQPIGRVIHLAGQAGVRYSLNNPHAYTESNITGFLHILEGCRQTRVKHLVYASSSSVYGGNTRVPFSVHDNVDHPVSLYAATKKANEVMAHSYAHLFGLPCTGLRFFTVYGPWGRPDMAMFIFTKAILAGEPITLFNEGKMRRDFTYVDDIVEGIVRLRNHAPEPNPAWSSDSPDPGSSSAPYRIYNIGNNQPVELLDLVSILERTLGREAVKQFAPMQPGDVPSTYANVDDLMRDVGFRPATPLEVGVKRFVDWYREYHGL